MPEAAGWLSIHDVMPETLTRVTRLLALAEAADWRRVTLLVVPGRAWPPAALDRLRAWQQAGHRLAGHGWRHRVDAVRGLRHRLHSRLISRDVAEHLARDADGILTLMRDCHGWFEEVGLRAPRLYVPPAWALGPVPRRRLAEQPFRFVETLAGVYDTRRSRCTPLPLLGYEADTPGRARALRLGNAAARLLARRRRPRLALHPFDDRLALAGDLAADMARFAPSRPRVTMMRARREGSHDPTFRKRAQESAGNVRSADAVR
ncbi:DUF2334 domain-containing protein [Spiribacter halobius]|uniref:DUF2334 domain-containing protein n=1 Tax=Sediminicurvatus halobius TaxID=2182432 RepID=A0A2U2MZ67_9GAMM|nr:DUF2334 domain-containing protein [Spiribacter halobius]PWG62029.1 DUF2334 domain-containing protein [Spiribacter halobius]UEX78711.1 DUF2334 domain-containing protein [Spiribacter halobius]